jgi:uncharacterized protein (DUF2235 family)
MKRIIVLIDGTWDKADDRFPTNVVKLDAAYKRIIPPFIKPSADDGTKQICLYHPGVGAFGDLFKRVLGGAIGFGLKKIILDAYQSIVAAYAPGDEIYIFGFSRGSYAARALAALIGVSGIQRQASDEGSELAWRHYRIAPSVRSGQQFAGRSEKETLRRYHALEASNALHAERTIKCVGVWDTVGSYGIPAGFGLASLARYITWICLGFHDTYFGNHIDVGLHAVSVDERRRPFVPTFWTIPVGEQPRGHVEQTWFAGVHSNVGGGYRDCGLSDRALIWMIARVQALTKLEFDVASIQDKVKPNLDGKVEDSLKGALISKWFPHVRRILPRHAIDHGAFRNKENPHEERINERVHWSVIKKLGRRDVVFGIPDTPYEPPNVPGNIEPGRIAEATAEELALAGE